jgi:putative ABC transport system permease protein
MNTLGLAWKEISHRRASLVSGLVAITLGIAVIVGIRSVAVASQHAVAVKMDSLGANVMVLPQGASMADYHSADIDGPTIPEEYVERIATSGLLGVENISPKLTRRVKVDDVNVVLTGILPANEVASKPVWQLEGMEGEAPTHVCTGRSGEHADPRLQRNAVEALAKGECLLGANVSSQLGLRVGHTATVQKAKLKVVQVLPSTGTVDDDRVFMHLHEMQEMLGTGRQVSAIEIMGCCNAISDGMLSKLRNVLPDTRVVGIAQIVSTQVETNRLMDRVSWGFLAIVLVVGGLSIGNFMWANVNQRRREIGILRMIGASRARIVNVLLVKAVVLGLLGGVLGYAIGTITTVALGPKVLGLAIQPLPVFLAWSAGLATFVAVLGSILPAWLASRFDPSANLQEV